jgi:hypothetical protein
VLYSSLQVILIIRNSMLNHNFCKNKAMLIYWGLRRPLHQPSAARKRVPGPSLLAQEWAD